MSRSPGVRGPRWFLAPAHVLAVAAAVGLGLGLASCADDVGAPGDPPPELTLGTHEQGRQGPDTFTALTEDGAELPIVLGQQGLWMVVLALRAHDTVAEPFELTATLVVGSQKQGEVTAAGQRFTREEDGLDYYYDIWVVVPDPSIATFKGDLAVTLTDADGTPWTLERQVRLTGGF